ncbi:MAG: BACON domain-containing carbohydrate-binding protein, partial [Desulfobacteraceae bacterium]|nr:BACON domain-containing carbohydrate-binding protein [Desulfobacteraceae bacterium]
MHELFRDMYINMPANANAALYGDTGPVNKTNVELSRAIPAGTRVTFTINMNGKVPHIIYTNSGSFPVVTYNSAGSGTLSIQATTFATTSNSNTSFISNIAFGILTDPQFGSTPLGIILQSNHWMGDYFLVLPGDLGSGGTFGTQSAKIGVGIDTLPGASRDARFFIPEDSISKLFGNGYTKNDLTVFLDNQSLPAGPVFDNNAYNFGKNGILIYGPMTFDGSKTEVAVGVTETELPELSVTPVNRNVTKEMGTTTFNVSNTAAGVMPWTASVTSGGDWLSIQSGNNGSNTGTITCHYAANTDESLRTGTIRVTAEGATGSPMDVTMTQYGSPAVILTGLSITGPASVNENNSATYTATATWSDGSTTTVPPTWSEDSGCSTINSAGILTTSEVTSDQEVTITASYTSGSITKNVTKSITVVEVSAVTELPPLGLQKQSGEIPLYGLAYGNNIFVTVGGYSSWDGQAYQRFARILTSQDGLTWTEAVSDEFNWLFRVTYGNGTFVAVGMQGTILTSTDGTTWSSQNSGTTKTLQGVTYGNGLFVAVGGEYSAETGVILTSSDGLQWDICSSSTFDELRGVTYGNGIFVAAGGKYNESSVILTSTDGMQWTQRDSSVNLYFNDVTYVNGQFIAVGQNSIIVTSTDGLNWTKRTGGSGYFYSSGYGSGLYIIVGERGLVLTSSDDIAWAEQRVGYQSFRSVLYENGLFVVVGEQGKIITSINGTNWVERTPSITSEFIFGGTYGNQIFVLVGGWGTILTSPNGINWTKRISGTSSSLNGVTYADDQFVAVGGDGTILQSTDGVTWTQRNSGTSGRLYDVTYGNGTFVAIGWGTNGLVVTSQDGIIWTKRSIDTSGESIPNSCITYGNGIFVAAGGDGIFTSPDGISWSHPHATGWWWQDITFHDGLFVTIGNDADEVLTSSNGADWTVRQSGSTVGRLLGVTHGQDHFVVVGEYGEILTSSDGTTWTKQQSGSQMLFEGITNGQHAFVIFGRNGSIWTYRLSGAFNDLVISAPANFETPGGTLASVPLFLTNPQMTEIEGIDITLIFDPSKLSAIDATLTGGILENQNYSLQANAGTIGEITLAISANADLFSGEGVLCYVNFQATGNPENTSSIMFNNAQINESDVTVQNGSIKIVQPKNTISGSVYYFTDDNPLTDVSLNLNGDGSYSSESDNNGDFSITDILPGNYTLTPSKSDDLGGLSATDASRIARHAVGLYPFSCMEKIAADVSLNGEISATDASRVARYAVGLISCLNDENNCTEWVFTPNTIMTCDTWSSITYDSTRSYSPLSADQTDQHFVAIRLGDVTGNWTPDAAVTAVK